MYEVALTEAYFPAQRDIDVREITVGGLLREVAAWCPDAEALVGELPSPRHRGAHFVVPIPGKGERGRPYLYELVAPSASPRQTRPHCPAMRTHPAGDCSRASARSGKSIFGFPVVMSDCYHLEDCSA